VNHSFPDLGIPKMRYFATFRIAGTNSAERRFGFEEESCSFESEHEAAVPFWSLQVASRGGELLPQAGGSAPCEVIPTRVAAGAGLRQEPNTFGAGWF